MKGIAEERAGTAWWCFKNFTRLTDKRRCRGCVSGSHNVVPGDQFIIIFFWLKSAFRFIPTPFFLLPLLTQLNLCILSLSEYKAYKYIQYELSGHGPLFKLNLLNKYWISLFCRGIFVSPLIPAESIQNIPIDIDVLYRIKAQKVDFASRARKFRFLSFNSVNSVFWVFAFYATELAENLALASIDQFAWLRQFFWYPYCYGSWHFMS